MNKKVPKKEEKPKKNNGLKTYEEIHLKEVDNKKLNINFYKTAGLIGGSILLVIFIIYFLFSYFYLNNPKRIFLNNYSNLITNFNNNIKIPNYNLNKDFIYHNEIKTTSTVNIKEDDKKYFKYSNLLTNLNNMSYTINLVNNKNNKMIFFYNNKLNNNSIFNLKIHQDKKHTYYYTSFLNKYIKNDFYNFNDLLDSNAKNEDLNYIEEIIKNTVNDNINKKYYKKSKTKIIYNNKITKVKKITLNINNEDLNTLINESILNLQKDKRAIKILSDYKNDFTKYQYKDKRILKDNLSISLYHKSRKPIKYEVSYGNNKYSYFEEEKKFEISNSKKIIKIKINSNNNFTFMDDNDNNIGKLVVKNNNINGEFISDNYEYSIKIIKSKHNYNGEFNVIKKNKKIIKITFESVGDIKYKKQKLLDTVPISYKYNELNTVDKSIINTRKEELNTILNSK